MREDDNLNSRVSYLDIRISKIEEKLVRIDVREAFRALEKYIVLDAIGSKTQMVARKIYTTKALEKT